MRRAFAIIAICAVAAAITPATPRAGQLADVSRHRSANDQAWHTTAIPQATLKFAGKGYGVSALSSDGRVAVVAGLRAVYLFRASSEGSWGSILKPKARLRLPDWARGNVAAVALSSDGTTVLVATGAVGNNPAAVYVFHVPSPLAWATSMSPTAKLTNAADPTGFGSGVALSSDATTALVGDLGGADVFHVATADSWRDSSRPAATLVADPVGAQAGGLGIAVALSADGTTALIGAMHLDTFVGSAYIFRAAATDAWISSATPAAVLTDGLIGLSGDGFGGAVTLSPDGMTALVGAPNVAFGPVGSAYFFQARSPGAWTSTADPDGVVEGVSSQYGGTGKPGDVPGWSVALSEEGTALVGEPSILGGQGAADVLHVAGPSQAWRFSTVSNATLTNAASPPRDLYGAAVGLSSDGTIALVSSVRASFIFTQAGSWGATYCYVPYAARRALSAAKRVIESTHCRVGKVTRVSTSRVRSDRVISQTPKPGERLAKGAKIDLKVSKGRNR